MHVRRTKTDEELQIVLALDKKCFPHDDPPYTEGRWWWIAWDDEGNPAGYAGITPMHDKTVYLCRAGVLPKYRGMGLQKKLIKVREAAAIRAGFTHAVTDCSKDNYKSLSNLIKCGYQLYNPEYVWSFPSSFYFQKRLIWD